MLGVGCNALKTFLAACGWPKSATSVLFVYIIKISLVYPSCWQNCAGSLGLSALAVARAGAEACYSSGDTLDRKT